MCGAFGDYSFGSRRIKASLIETDCSQYYWVTREVAKGLSLAAIVGEATAASYNSTPAYLKSLCNPGACTIASSCSSTSDPLFSSNNPLLTPDYEPGVACCTGGPIAGTCANLGNALKTCGLEGSCQASGDVNDVNQYCVPIDQKANQWVGIVITLIGAGMLNVGLNLQKLALRKRHEKTQERKLERRMKIIQRLAAVRLPSFLHKNGSVRSRTPSFTNLFRHQRENGEAAGAAAASAGAGMVRAETHTHSNAGRSRSSTPVEEDSAAAVTVAGGNTNSSNPRRPQVPAHIAVLGGNGTGSGAGTADEDFEATQHLRFHNRSSLPRFLSRGSIRGNHGGVAGDVTHQFGIDLPRPTLRILNRNTIAATVTREDGTTENISIPAAKEDQLEFQKNLNFGTLVKNPIWVLGFLIFTFSNVMNFIALQFAPQSLVAPLGSISLVVNVVLAPIINKEKWTWRDIVGVVLIVAGSSMTVVFAGVAGKDFQICVLLALFRRIPTIIFLTVTIGLALFVFLLICFIEKNLDLNNDGPAVTRTVHPPANRESVLAWTSKMSSKAYHLPGNIVRRASDVLHGKNATSSRQNTESGEPTEMSEVVHVVVDDEGQPVKAAPPTKETSEITDASNATLAPPPAGAGTVAALSSGSSLTIHQEEHEDDARPVATEEAEVIVDGVPTVRRPSAATSDADNGTSGSGQFLVVAAPKVPPQPSTSLSPPMQQGSSSSLTVPSPSPPSEITPSENGDDHPMGSTVIGLEEALAEPDLVPKPTMGQRMYKILPRPMKRAVDWWQRIDIIPRIENKIPTDSTAVRIVLPFSYATLGGLMATLTVLFAKSTIHLLSESIFQGFDQYNNIYSWVITAVTFITAVSQIYWINMGLQRYDALLQVPVFYVIWTVFDVVGGGVYFQEFDGFNARQFGLFFLSVAIIFVGVGILGDRLKKAEGHT
ncbi:hypothetical protein HK101_005422 [Irineochytrium annulatum]|nr:hypothetical protein HK101_005422 [Irineochytrium annulatum]